MDVWADTIREIEQSLAQCQANIRLGALSESRALLQSIGALDTTTNGSGTVAAIAAVFFVSVFAADPVTGMLEAAFSHGADTDTIAAMTGGLMGSLLGTSWLPKEWLDVQDNQYLRAIAQELLESREKISVETQVSRWHERNTAAAYDALDKINVGEKVDLGGPGICVLKELRRNSPIARNTFSRTWKLHSEFGQTLYASRVQKQQDISLSTTGKRIISYELETNTDQQALISLVGLFPHQARLSSLFLEAGRILEGLERQADEGRLALSGEEQVVFSLLADLQRQGKISQADVWQRFALAVSRLLR
jgi:hypothetical protein